jgi:hypothetical protein
MNEVYSPCIFGILQAPIVYLYKLATDGMATSKDPRMLYLDNYQLFTAQFVLDLIQKADSGACLSNHLKGLPYQLPSGITLKTFILVNYQTLYEYLYCLSIIYLTISLLFALWLLWILGKFTQALLLKARTVI